MREVKQPRTEKIEQTKRIIEKFLEYEGNISIRELSNHLGIPKSTIGDALKHYSKLIESKHAELISGILDSHKRTMVNNRPVVPITDNELEQKHNNNL